MSGSGTQGPRPILVLTQGFAGDRLGARLAPALQRAFEDRELIGLGGPGMAAAGVRLLARTDGISAMGYSGVLPEVPAILGAMLRTSRGTRDPLPACVVAVDIWQPLRVLHRFAPHLKAVPHLCYLPPGPNFTGISRVHGAAARAFARIVTPFPHQARLYREAGAEVTLAAHAGLEVCRAENVPLPADARQELLALLPGSRSLEVRYSLPIYAEVARRVREQHPAVTPVACCASDEVAALVKRAHPELERSRNARDVLARARFALICSGTAALEAAILGCPGVVTYHGSPLQRWEWNRFHVPKLAELRAAGIASPYVALPNIISGAELYPELLGEPAASIAEAVLKELGGNLGEKRARLDQVRDTLSWEDAGETVAQLASELLT